MEKRSLSCKTALKLYASDMHLYYPLHFAIKNLHTAGQINFLSSSRFDINPSSNSTPGTLDQLNPERSSLNLIPFTFTCWFSLIFIYNHLRDLKAFRINLFRMRTVFCWRQYSKSTLVWIFRTICMKT